MADNESDPERDRLSARLGRYASVGANLAGAAAAMGAARLIGGAESDRKIGEALRQALGRSKGPLMKIAQILATVPDLLPKDIAEELAKLQANAPPMAWPFVERRMRAELGPDWKSQFAQFEREAARAASLGQVHRAAAHDGRLLACKLQYPDMASAVETDIAQLNSLVGAYRRFGKAIDPSEISQELAERLREELDYEREAKAAALYREMLKNTPAIRVPETLPQLCTKRLLTMTWLEGAPISDFLGAPQEVRNRIAVLLFEAWWSPMGRYGVIHGDPHLGNYTFTDDAAELNLLDFGAIRIFPPRLVSGVKHLYEALKADDVDAIAHAYNLWGFGALSKGAIEGLTIWAKFIFAPMLDDRERTVADGISPGEYGRREIMAVKTALQEHGPVKPPREFLFLDRAAIGLGSAFIRLGARLNFHALFEAQLAGAEEQSVEILQAQALKKIGLD